MARRALLILLLALGCSLFLPVGAADQSAVSPTDDEYYELYKVLVDTIDQVERNYVQDINRREIVEAAIQGILTKLDPYSSYISPEEMTRFRDDVEHRFGGIGIQISVQNGFLTILSPLVDTPAYRAGLRAGDVILEIEGESAEGITIDEAVKRLKGEAGTSVTITVQHPGDDDPIEVTLEREIIAVETVLGDRRSDDDSWQWMVDPELRIGYLRVTAFSRDTSDDLRDVLEQLTAEGMRGLIIDLRFNPGGLLTTAIDVCDMFISSGRIVSTEGRNTKPRTWDARPEDTFEGFPLAIIVNRYSASASEIVSACLQDHDRAVIVGERTWGKGSVQNVVELEGGASALKLTTASYQRPSGEKIHRFPDDGDEDEWGVTPNEGYRVRLRMDEMRQLVSYRRQRDIVIFHDADEDGEIDVDLPPAEDESTPANEEGADEGDPDGEDPDRTDAEADEESEADEIDEEFVDRQLAKALEYVVSELQPLEAASRD